MAFVRTRRRTIFIGLILAACIFTLPGAVAIKAQNPPQLDQYVHTAWGLKDGAPLWVNSIAQTPDGFLWLAGHDGLFRFDGLKFEFFRPLEGPALEEKQASAVYADQAGDLWVGYIDGEIARVSDGVVTIYNNAFGAVKAPILCFVSDHDGIKWAATTRGLLRLRGRRWEIVDSHFGVPAANVGGLFVDPEGALWFTSGKAVYSLARGGEGKAVPLNGVSLVAGESIGVDPSGRLWVADIGAAVRPVTDSHLSADRRDKTAIAVGASNFLFNDDGSLWIPTVGDGLRRVRFPGRVTSKVKGDDAAVEAFTMKDGLTSNMAICAFRDREGDIWVGTFNGLDRFRESKIHTISFPKTLGTLTVGLDASGNPWVVSAGDLYRLDSSKGIFAKPQNRGINGFIQILQDSTGAEWWAGEDDIVRIKGNQKTHIPLPVSPMSDCHLLQDGSGSVYAFASHIGFFHWHDGHWIRPLGLPLKFGSDIAIVTTEQAGNAWIGFMDGSLQHFHGGKIETVVSSSGPNAGSVKAITVRGDHVWFAGEYGLALYRPGQPLQIMRHDFPRGAIRFILETSEGDLWIVGRSNVTQFQSDSLRQLLNGSGERWDSEKFEITNVLPSILQGAVLDRKERLWIFSSDGAAWIDTRHVARNPLKPPVSVTAIRANGRTYRAQGTLLPAETRNVDIEFAALSLPVPELVQVRYKLDGVDRDWQDSGVRRDASYTNLGPGFYHFHVIACNNDGVWNNDGAAIEFRIAPAWFQTTWFMASWITVACLLLWAVYRIRVRSIARAISARFDERLDERTRMARELHDTFLQTVQGSKMVADDALAPSSDQVRMRHALEKLSAWLGQAVTEGRAALHALRVSTTEENELAEFLNRALKEQCHDPALSVAVSVIGDARKLHPIVRDEISLVAKEAIRNACLHSRASQLRVELRYADDLRLCFKDNGVGIDPDVLHTGKAGHFGIQGMKERSARIRAKITILSSRNNGTEVVLKIPGDVAYAHEKLTPVGRFVANFGARSWKKRSGKIHD